MTVIYSCRHCKHVIGKIKRFIPVTSVYHWDRLSASATNKMIHYKSNGDILVRVICRPCEQTLMAHPEYHEMEYFIH